MKKFAAIFGIIVLLVTLFSAPWAVLALAGLVGIVGSIRKFLYFRKRREPEKAKTSAIVLGVSVLAFAVGGYFTPSTSTEKEVAQTDSTPKTEQRQKKTTASTSKEISLSLTDSVETDDEGTLSIVGKTEPHATVYIASASSAEESTADSDGNFELTYELSTDSEQELEIIAELDGQKVSKQVLAKPSTAFIAAKEAEAKKEAEELRIAQEAEAKKKAEEEKQAEIQRLTTEAETAVAKAEAEQTRENVTAATAAITAIPEGDQVLSTRVAAVDTAIQAREEQEAQQAAAAAAEAELAAQQEQNNVEQTVLVTRTGEKYHTRKCGNGTYTPATLQEAQSRGLSPCSKCFG